MRYNNVSGGKIVSNQDQDQDGELFGSNNLLYTVFSLVFDLHIRLIRVRYIYYITLEQSNMYDSMLECYNA